SSAILNILINVGTRLVDVRFKIMPNRGLFCNILSCLSHTFALSMTLGKILGVTTRLVSICYPIESLSLWSRSGVWATIAAQLLVPLGIYAYMPFMEAAFAPTTDGYGHYLGIAPGPFKVAKAFGTLGYLLFFFTIIPMCVLSVAELCRNRKKFKASTQGWASSKTKSATNERVFAFVSVILTLTHALKATQQASIRHLITIEDISNLTIVWSYIIPNTLTSFSEPILMLVSSQALR
ncbi:hypothetical protein PENTCL1PPCAC_15945, partial [Pristionchus entomophagus]